MWIHVYSGLASRCITLAQAYWLVKARGGQKLVIVWPLEESCNIHFWEVFDKNIFSDIKLKVIEITTSNRRYFDCYKSDGIRLNIKKKCYGKAICAAILIFMDMLKGMKEKIPFLMFRKNYFDYTPPESIGWSGEKYQNHLFHVWNQVQKALLGKKAIYIKAYCGIIKKGNREQECVDFSVIRFREQYWKKAEEIVVPKEKYIGIHIRRTDHTVAINASTTKAFLQRMNEIIEEQDDVKFFLATDDITEEENLRKIYGNKLVVQTNKRWGRANSAEMQSGIIDCLCLSRCEYILGSYASVFSFFAAKYGGKKLSICSNEKNN